MGDRGLPASWREMQGYGSHTYQWINAEGERFWVKYHFKSNQGVSAMTGDEAEPLAGSDAGLLHPRPAGKHRRRQLPVLGPARPGHAVRGRQDVPLQPVRPDQGVAARGLPADQGRHHGAEPEHRQDLFELNPPATALRVRRAGCRAGCGQME